MKVQISFDALDLEKNLEVARQVVQFADILEIGSLPLLKHGVRAIEAFRKEFPQATILADTKIIDTGRDSVTLAAQVGADWVSVMAGTTNEVIHGVCSKAHDLGKRVMVDILDASSPGQAALEAKSLGADALLFHQPADLSSSLVFLDNWTMVRGNTDLAIFVSSRITKETAHQVIALKPDGIVVGKAICESEDPASAAQFFYDACKK